MKKSFKFTAKKVEQAISDGLSALGVQMDEVEVNIISTGGMFKKAEVELVLDVPDAVEEKPVVKAEPPKQEVKQEVKPQPKQEPQNLKQKPQDKKLFGGAQEVKQNQHNHKNQNNKNNKPNQNKPQEKAVPAFAAKFSSNSGDSFEQNQSNANTQAHDFAPQAGDSLASFGKGTRPPQDKRTNGGKLFAKNPTRERTNFVSRKNDRVPATEDNKKVAEEFLNKMFELGGFEGKVNASIEEGLFVNIDTENAAIIGHRGEALDAVQYLTSLVVNGGKDKFVVVGMDALGYKEKRKETLRRLAQKMADKCLKNNRRMGLEPMNSQDRKEIHAYLSEIEGVVTRSEGHEPNRRIVVYPERKK